MPSIIYPLLLILTKFADINNLIQHIDNYEISEPKACLAEEVASFLTQPFKQTKLLCLNIRSISKNFDGLITLLSRIKLDMDFVILTECWLSHCRDNLPSLSNYNIHHSTDDYNQNDGVVVFINNSVTCSVLEPVFPEANCLVIKVSNHTAIIALYRPHCFKLNVPYFLTSLNSILQTLVSFPNIILVGDINIDIATNNTEAYCGDYLNLLAMHGMLPAHTLPTRKTSCLDHFILRTKKSSSSFVLHSSITDHDAIMLCIDLKQPNYVPKVCSKIDYVGMNISMDSLDFSPIILCDDPNIAANLLVNLLSNALISNTKLLRLPRRTRTIKPWITIGLLRCVRNRDNMHKKLKRCPGDNILSITYRRYRNFCNNILKKVKREYLTKEIRKACTDSRKLWDIIKTNTNTKKLKDSASNLISASTPSLSVNSVNEYFVNIGKSLAERVQLNNNHNIDSFTQSPVLESIVMFDTDEDEVEKLILSLKNSCTVGWDGISSRILKQYKNTLVPPITHICKLSLSKGIFPDAFKRAIIKPIFKAGSRNLVSNYRPISILPSLSKILERIMNVRLIKYLEGNNLLSPRQYGFRATKSTADAIHDLTDFIVTNLDGSKKCLSVFLDLAKAFDTVPIPLLLKKLERMGIRGLQLSLFQSYLSCRSQCVQIDNHRSADLPIHYGIPQGSILGPSLFLIFINDLCNLQLTNGKIVSFADDTALVFEADSLQDVFKFAQDGLNLVLDWLAHNHLTINAEKTKYMLFSIRNTLQHNFNLTAHSCQSYLLTGCSCPSLENVPTIKYLGLNLDQNLNFKSHINLLSSRIRKLIFIFKTLRNIADYRVLKMVYYALCQSILTYCITTWGGVHKTSLKKLEVSQRALLKVATFRSFDFPTFDLYRNCKVLTVRQLFVLNTILKKHTQLTYSTTHVQNNKRRRDLVCSSYRCKSKFMQRFFVFLGPYLYNKCNVSNKIYSLNNFNCKNLVVDWLLKMNYDVTENLIEVIS